MTHPLLEALREAEESRKASVGEVNSWTAERDETIRHMLETGGSVKDIQTVTGLSRERIYQIRDRRR
jgi:hypothetical protein